MFVYVLFVYDKLKKVVSVVTMDYDMSRENVK